MVQTLPADRFEMIVHWNSKEGRIIRGRTMPELAVFLANITLPVPVIDKTGLEGMYKINLAFSVTLAGGKQMSNDPDLYSACSNHSGSRWRSTRVWWGPMQIET